MLRRHRRAHSPARWRPEFGKTHSILPDGTLVQFEGQRVRSARNQDLVFGLLVNLSGLRPRQPGLYLAELVLGGVIEFVIEHERVIRAQSPSIRIRFG